MLNMGKKLFINFNREGDWKKGEKKKGDGGEMWQKKYTTNTNRFGIN
jgi:hypothetical protein